MTSSFRAVNIDCNFDYTYERQRLDALGVQLILKKSETEEAIIQACQDADVMVVEGTRTPITARVMAALPCCKLIVKYAVGVDNIDVGAASNHRIVVANAADFCTEEVSDHTVALLLASSRRVMSADRYVRTGQWAGFVRAQPIRRISQLTLGLVGMGRIARATARKMAGFGLKIIAADPYVTSQSAQAGVEMVSLDRLWREADLISVHVPLMPETRGLLNEAAFRSMKPTAIVVNTSRGPVIDEKALIQALREKWIAGAALDVVEEEPLALTSPLREFDQVILTPHCAADSTDSMLHVRRTVIDSIEAVYRGYWPPFPLNPKITPRLSLKAWSEFPAA